MFLGNLRWGRQNIHSNTANLNSPHLKIQLFTTFFTFDLAQTPKMSFGPHNYTHGWKAVFAAKILAPRFRGLEAVTNALDFFQRIG